MRGNYRLKLAQLKHLSTRLVRRKTGLDQQKGAVGLRGPGETQLETDRRLIKVRISQLQNRLAKVEKQRNQNRQTRQKSRHSNDFTCWLHQCRKINLI